MTMKERIQNSVAQKLSAASDEARKAEIVEELSGNLFAKYQDLLAQGMDAEEAYEAAMDSLGDVSELVALAGGPTTRAEFDKTMDAIGAKIRGVASDLKGPVKDAVNGVKHAAKAAKEPLCDMGRSIADAVKSLEITVDVDSAHQFVYTVPTDDISGLELRLSNGDATFKLWDQDVIQVIERSSRTLDENKHASFLRREDGVLCIEQGSTAVGFVFFSFGAFESDFEIFLPRRLWQSVTVYTGNGDICFEEGFEVENILISSTNGDTDLGAGMICQNLSVTSVNGDVEGDDAVIRKLTFRATSGDLDVRFAQLPEGMDIKTVSGDISLELPENDGFSLAYHQTSGDLDSEFELTTSLSRHDGVATYKGAETPQYQVSAISGDIDIRRG